MIDGRGWVKLTDFGVARQSDASGAEATMAGGTLVGTPSYMSPEQIKGIPASAASDLFATGVVLYQCLTLHKPFIGESRGRSGTRPSTKTRRRCRATAPAYRPRSNAPCSMRWPSRRRTVRRRRWR
jgi:serine/threonine protein kinase